MLSVIAYNYLVREESLRYSQWQQKTVYDSADKLRTIYMDAKKITNLVACDDEIYALNQSTDAQPYSIAHQLQEKLITYSSLSDAFKHVWFYTDSNTYLYSGTDSCGTSRFASQRIVSDAQTALLDDLSSGRFISCTDMNDKGKYVLFALPVLTAGSHQRFYLIFQVSYLAFNNSLELMADDHIISLSLSDQNGNIFYASPVSDASKQVTASDNKRTPQAISRNNISIYQLSDASSRQHYQIVYDNIPWRIDISLSSFSQSEHVLTTVCLLVFLLCIGFFLVFILARVTYSPIQGLKHQLSQGYDAANENDDYAYIDKCIESMQLDHERLRASLEQHTREAKHFLFHSLLSGYFLTLADFNAALDSVQLPSSVYTLMAYAARASSDAVSDILPFKGGIQIRYIPADIYCEIGLIFLNEKETTTPEATQKLLDSVLPDSNLGLSLPCSQLQDIPIAVSQALIALACGKQTGHQQLYGAECIKTPAEPDLSQDAQHLSMAYAPSQLMIAAGAKITKEKLRLTIEENLQLFFISDKEQQQNWDAIFSAFMKKYHKQKPMGFLLPIEQMKAYIQEHSFTPDFSVKRMAGDFQMSSASLSQFFRQESGMLLNDYITDLKIKEACRLLNTTSLSIADIGLAVGYFNAYSFTRRFQQIVGVSPSEYRAREKRE